MEPVAQPGAKTFDFRLSRNFTFADKVSLEATIDIFNVLNWANWTTDQTQPVTKTGALNPAFGALDLPDNKTREVQFGLRLRF